jgi:hypothetical protein
MDNGPPFQVGGPDSAKTKLHVGITHQLVPISCERKESPRWKVGRLRWSAFSGPNKEGLVSARNVL